MATYKTTDTELTSVADAIRSKGGTSASLLYPTGWVTAIGDIKAMPATITAGDTPIVQSATMARSAATTLTDVGVSLTIPKAGTWRIKYVAVRTNTSSSYTWGTQLYKGTTAIGTEKTSWTSSYYQIVSNDVVCAKNDVFKIYARGRGGSYYILAGMLTACCSATLV